MVAWGSKTQGGDAHAVTADLQHGVHRLYSTKFAFAALKHDGSVVVWGDRDNGGSNTFPINAASGLTSGVVSIYSTNHAFAAIKPDGAVTTWGRYVRVCLHVCVCLCVYAKN